MKTLNPKEQSLLDFLLNREIEEIKDRIEDLEDMPQPSEYVLQCERDDLALLLTLQAKLTKWPYPPH